MIKRRMWMMLILSSFFLNNRYVHALAADLPYIQINVHNDNDNDQENLLIEEICQLHAAKVELIKKVQDVCVKYQREANVFDHYQGWPRTLVENLNDDENNFNYEDFKEDEKELVEAYRTIVDAHAKLMDSPNASSQVYMYCFIGMLNGALQAIAYSYACLTEEEAALRLSGNNELKDLIPDVLSNVQDIKRLIHKINHYLSGNISPYDQTFSALIQDLWEKVSEVIAKIEGNTYMKRRNLELTLQLEQCISEQTVKLFNKAKENNSVDLCQ